MKLGFIGLGNMGLPMAINLLKANYQVYGLNRSKGAERIFSEAGGKTGLTIAEIASTVDVLMTCLPLPTDVEDVYFGSNGIVENASTGLIVLDFSTVSPDLNVKISEKAAEKGIEYMDSPISGGNVGAESGTLSIMAGGKQEVYDKVYPIFEVLGRNIYHTGKIGSGSTIKLINQFMVGFHTQSVAEALVLSEKMGIDQQILFDILNASFAQSRIFERHLTQFISQEQYQPGFALKLLSKDMNLVQKMAKDNEIPLPIGEQVREMIETAKEKEYGEQDMASMYLYVKEKVIPKSSRTY
jgi:3-hydroxyisobutyrate dehydrogenase